MIDRAEEAGLVRYAQPYHLLGAFSAEQLAGLQTIWREERVEAGTIFCQEGEVSDELCFLMEGEVAVLKWDAGRTRQHTLGTISAGQLFGDISFLTNAPRSATLKALTPIRFIALSKKALYTHHPEAPQIEQILVQHIARLYPERFQARDSAYIASLERENQALRRQLEFGTLFATTVVAFSIVTLLNHYLVVNAITDTTIVFDWILLLCLLLPLLYYIRTHHYPLQDFGLKLTGLGRAIAEASLLFAVVALPLSLLVRSGSFGLTFNPGRLTAGVVISYFFHCLVQEFAARGVMQTTLERLFQDITGRRALLWSSLFFAVFHIHFGFVAVIAVFFASLIFGTLYRRHRTLAGVTLLHWVLGMTGAVIGVLR